MGIWLEPEKKAPGGGIFIRPLCFAAAFTIALFDGPEYSDNLDRAV